MNERPCWRRNGVWGRERPRCPRLEEVIHCRNCEEYIRPGRELLERLARAHSPSEPAPEQPRDEAPQARPPAQLVFRVNGNWLALPGTLILRVSESAVPRPLPHQQHTTLRGLVNVGGRLLVCLSLTDTLGPDEAPLAAFARGVWSVTVRPEETVRCVLLDPERTLARIRECIA